MLVIPVNKVVDPKRIIGKKWRAEEEKRHKGSLTQKRGEAQNCKFQCMSILLRMFSTPFPSARVTRDEFVKKIGQIAAQPIFVKLYIIRNFYRGKHVPRI
jgi:hypothetical protein